MTTLKGKIEYLEQPQMSQETLNKLGAGALKFDSRMMNDPSMGYFAAEQKRIQDDYHKELARIGAGAALEIGATALIPAGMGIGAKVGTKLLKPVVGKAISRAIGQGVFSGGLSGGLSGTGHGLMTNQNPVVSGVAGIAGGALGGGALGFGAGKIANTIRTNKINDLLSKRADWGIAYQKASGNPALAIETLLEKKQGFVPYAVNKRGIGNIDFIWGDSRGGLKHIIERRNEEGLNGEQFIRNIPNIIKEGNVYSKDFHIGRKYVLNNGYEAAIRQDWDKKPHNWLASSYLKKTPSQDLSGLRAFEQTYANGQQISPSDLKMVPSSTAKRLMWSAPLSNISSENGASSISELSADNNMISNFGNYFNPSNGQKSKLWDVIHNQKEKAFDSLYDLINRNKW